MSCYEARAYVWRSNLPETQKMPISALRIGDLSMVIAPYEMFSTSARTVKRDTPFDMTFIITCSGKHIGYIPTQEAYDYGCYESHTSKLSPGTAEALVEGFVSLLKDAGYMSRGCPQTFSFEMRPLIGKDALETRLYLKEWFDRTIESMV